MLKKIKRHGKIGVIAFLFTALLAVTLNTGIAAILIGIMKALNIVEIAINLKTVLAGGLFITIVNFILAQWRDY